MLTGPLGLSVWVVVAASGVVSVVHCLLVFAEWCGCWLVLVVGGMVPRRFGCVEGVCVWFCGYVGSFGGFVGVVCDVVGGVGGGWAIS